ncbi:MAG: TonB-dependent receptor, partial [Cyclobacteriaceae bacterium]|nr:TonB-dependent receptor [Cyclobacteriaceae bacterium HetDA_MAG_MS6]
DIAGRSAIDVALELDITALDEVVVVGYGTTQKRDLTGSVASIGTENISNMPAPRFEHALAGKAAGLQITNSDPSPGTAPTIRIRGNNSLTGDNNPLIVIDGVLGADLQSLNPNDVASAQILKDASATAIYGSRGANGVIVITTKRGEIGKTTVNFNSSVGFQQVLKKLDLLGAEEHLSLLDASTLFTVPANFSPSDPGSFAIDNPILTGEGTDWQDEVFQDAMYQNYHVSVTGGNEKTRFALLGEYLDQEGVIRSSNYEKAGVRLNIDHDINDNLRIGNSMNLFRAVTNGIVQNVRGGGLSTTVATFSPIVPVFAADGTTYNEAVDGSLVDNPAEALDIRQNEQVRNYLLNNLFFEWDIIPDLTLKVSGTYINKNRETKTYIPGALFEARADSGRASISNRRDDEWLIENTLSYGKTINGKHRINSVVGFTAQTFQDFRSSFTGTGFATDALGFNGIGLARNVVAPSTNLRKSTIASFLGRVAYVFDDKYLLTISGRADGSSKFAVNNKWAFFPAASASWVISNEEFMSGMGFLSQLKLRAGYGETGSQAIGPYQSLAALKTGGNGGYAVGQEFFSNEINIETLGNGGLRWETTEQTNIGIDVGILDQRVTFTADYYYKKTRDLLFDERAPYAAGLERQVQNIGNMDNWGWEFSTEARVLDGDFKWDLTANISFLNNEVTKLGQDSVLFLDGTVSSLGNGFRPNGIVTEGEPIGSFYGFKYDGIFQNDAEAAASFQPGAAPGQARYVNVNGDSLFNEDDKVIIGKALPDFIFGFTSNWSYKGFDLSVAIQGSIGNDVANLSRAFLERPGGGQNGLKSTLDYWTPENPTNDMVAIDQQFDVISDRFIEDGSFVRFRNISLGYNFPSTMLDKLNIQRLRVYASAINWITITDYSGYDPEVNSRSGAADDLDRNVLLGYDYGAYPGSKQLVFGLNLGF